MELARRVKRLENKVANLIHPEESVMYLLIEKDYSVLNTFTGTGNEVIQFMLKNKNNIEVCLCSFDMPIEVKQQVKTIYD